MNYALLILALISTLCVISRNAAYAAEQTAPRTISDVTELLDQYRPDPSLAERNRAKARAQPPADLTGRDLATFLHARAWASQAIGDSKQQIADLRRAIELSNTDQYQQDLSNALTEAGSRIESVQIRERLASRTIPGRVVALYSSLVRYFHALGDVDAARAALQRVESAYNFVAANRSSTPDTLVRERAHFLYQARASMLAAEGKYDQAEVAHRRAHREAQAHADGVERRISGRTFSEGQTPESHREITANQLDTSEQGLARFLMGRNQLLEAELLVRNSLRRTLARLGRDNPRTARVMVLFADILRDQGRYQESLQIALEAVASYERSGAAPFTNALAGARRTVGQALVSQARWNDAIKVYDDMRSGLATDPESLAAFGKGDASWGLALVKAGRAPDAVVLLAPRVEQDRKVLGELHPVLAFSRGVLGIALARTNDRRGALAEFRAATSVLLDADSGAPDQSPGQLQLLRHILEGYIELLIEIRGTELERGLTVDAGAEAFRLADLTRGQSTQRALAASSARAAAGDAALAGLVRHEQDLGVQERALYGYLLNQVSLAPAEQSPRVISDMRKRLEEIAAEQKKLRADLQKRFPRYASLINPRPATAAETQAALREGEVLLSVLVADDRTYVWAVPKQGAIVFHAAPMGETDVSRVVASLRRALDAGEVPIERFPEFDVVAAHRLYATLLKPVEGAWKNAHTLVVVSNGALAQLPLSLLPTEAVAPAEAGIRFERYKNVPWLIKQIGVTQLPAVNTLVTLRALPQGNAQRTAFAGFGDPQFGAVAPAAAPIALGMRNLAVTRAGEGKGAVDWAPYSELSPLPDTRDEILAIAAALKADLQKDVFLGAQASKQNVKSANLSTRRIVAFATHGLIPGDFPNLDEPALALSAPDGKAETGLLTLGDILALKLDADWVVLSACNTGAGDGAGVEAISGLGRGFFYAGSRALLVTHWPVETRSARQLVTALFERYAGSPTLSRAEALKQASLAVMEDSAKDASGKALFSYAHPLFWAPYALVGDGGR